MIKYHGLSSSGSQDISFSMYFMGQMPKSLKGNNFIKYSQNYMKSQSGHLHYVSKLTDIMILAQAVV